MNAPQFHWFENAQHYLAFLLNYWEYLGYLLIITLIISWFKKHKDIDTIFSFGRYALLVFWGLTILYYLFFGVELLYYAYSGAEYVTYNFNRASGPYKWAYVTMVIFPLFLPPLLLFKKIGDNKYWIVAVGILINLGSFFEKYVIIVTSLHRDFLP